MKRIFISTKHVMKLPFDDSVVHVFCWKWARESDREGESKKVTESEWDGKVAGEEKKQEIPLLIH